MSFKTRSKNLYVVRAENSAFNPVSVLRGSKNTIKLFRRAVVRRMILALTHEVTASGSSILVIAPHPDDEAFACGGLIALRKLSGSPVNVAYLTRGGASHRGCCDISSSDLMQARQNQAVAAGQVLGLNPSDQHWLDLEDGRIPRANQHGFDEAVLSLSNLLDQLSPQEILCPHPMDCWPDHQAAAQITVRAQEKYGKASQLYYYLIWGWYSLPLRCLRKLGLRNALRLDIKAVHQTKLVAIRRYAEPVVPGCGRPYVGRFPNGFLTPFLQPYEISFATLDVQHGS